MKLTDSNVIRFHLQVLYGISIKSLEKKRERLMISGSKIFGVPLENLPRCYIPEFGLVPCFLVDACSFLLERGGTVGLFRKPGCLARIKTLRFCRELPEPLFPSELHAAMLKAQSLPNLQDRMAALQLLSCLLPARNASCLHYMFDYLAKVSQRCSENLMTSSNLAIVFAPCLLPPPNTTEMSEGRLELRVLVLRTFIENPHLFGVIPKTVIDSMEYLMNFHFVKDVGSKSRSKKRHSFKGMRSVKTVPLIQGGSKLRPPEQSHGSTSGDRPTLRRSLGLDSFPNILLFRTYMPSADQSFRPAAALLDDVIAAEKKLNKMPQDGLKRFTRGVDGSPAGKLKLMLWRRRSSL
uniref:rho GTPase-activating protein 11A isoform X2 n=1 Tax=Maylandia zebra TaxID=106582 RepID=UPI00032997DA|nr:rho GTPase-activating protein 11A isoform X2 [Maylandia zebra]